MVRAALEFLLLHLYKNRAYHAAAFVMGAVLVFLSASVLLTKSSIQQQTMQALQSKPDLIVQQMRGGRQGLIDKNLVYELEKLPAVTEAKGRIHGSYLHGSGGTRLYITGYDPFGAVMSKQFANLLPKEKLPAFLQEGALVAPGLRQYLRGQHYKEGFTFYLPEGRTKHVTFMGTFGADRGGLSNDMMVVGIANARQILGIDQSSFSDIVLRVPNDLEHDSVLQTIYERFDNVHVITKEQLKRKYQNAYDFSSGLFLSFAMLALVVFCLILYFKYAYAGSAAKKEVGILRALGFSIAAVMKLKLAESFIASSLGFFAGFIAAFGYVYGLDAPLIKDIFLGRSSFEYLYDFSPAFEPALFLKLYILFVSASMAAVLVPTWRVSVSSPKEALK